MKESECDHFVNSIVYLMKQTSEYCKTKGSQFFEELNLGVCMAQYVIIDTISFNPGICQRDLAKLILKDRSYTSRLLDTLEESGFLERKLETKGKRLVKKLYLTEKGSKILLGYHDKLRNEFSQIFKNISDEDFATTRRVLEQMKSCMSEHTVMPL